MFARILSTVLLIAAAAVIAPSQSNVSAPPALSKAEIDRIVAKVSDYELRFREALTDYAFNRKAAISTVGIGGQITGTYRRDSFLTFNSAGERFERVEYAPISTLKDLVITPADLENLGGIDPFAIEPSKLSNYSFSLIGQEKIDELELYVFDVTPRILPDPKKGIRYFSGRIWVDKDDLMIVKSKGKALPEGKNERFPIIETWRENIDGKFWFPSYSSSDDELVFDKGQVVKIRIRVKYSDYRVGRTDVRILEDDEPVKPEPKPSPSPTKP
ncbi:MAG: hypothetical protein KF736_05400 [Acidobacteria bacterium]|nr:hypothetical protein [Acidobacteriota bacterium]MCW5948579.1 hypothetical protein [Pyrinomonadaceae bacterium]